jgi:hypothetical protein
MATSYQSPGVYVEQAPAGSAPIAGVGTSTAAFVGVFGATVQVPNPEYDPKAPVKEPVVPETKAFTVPTPAGKVKLITNFTEFKEAFGDFSVDAGHRALAHAVYGFFLNGGTRCYVTYVAPSGTGDWTNTSIASALELLEPIEEIAIVAAPGLSGSTPHGDLKAHCEAQEPTRFAVLDTKETFGKTSDQANLSEALTVLGTKNNLPVSDYMALYFPWIQVYDPATRGPQFVPPSGHIAGVYARVDARRGVHKAPANESVLGATGLRYALSKDHQSGLNPLGVNAIRLMNGNIKVWGARTVGGDGNGEFKYVNVRRLFNYLRASIEQGTQWAVFEPNTPELWAKITRNVSAFLKDVWSAGALFGDKPEDAFYVKCDAETNPPSQRDNGMVVTEVGVAIVRPAEFVIFRLGQKAAS